MSLFHRILMIAALSLFGVSAHGQTSQTTADPSGHWVGAVSAPFGEVPVEIDLTRNAQGELAGTFSGQNLKGYPLTHVVGNGKVVSFEVSTADGGIFDGILLDDNTSMAGDFAAKAGSAPFSLKRKGDARIDKLVPSAAIAKPLEGLWNGTLDVDGVTLRLVLKLVNQPDGTAIGTIANLDQGAVEIPIAAITQKDSSLTLDVKVVGGSYSASLNAQGTVLSGTWTQGPLALPLSFKRVVRN